MENQKEFNLNSTNIVMLAWEKRRLLIIIAALAFVVSAIASFLITPLFKSTAVIYPPTSNQQSKEIFTTNLQAGLTSFGEDAEAEQLLQILSSSTLRDIVIIKLDLMQNWGISPNEKYAHNKVYGIFNNYISFRPTQYQSVEVEVMDPSPQMAARIANTIVDVSDSIMRSIKAQIAQQALIALEEQYKVAEQEMSQIEDSLKFVMGNGVISLMVQTEELYKAYAKAIVDNNKNGMLALEQKMEPLKKYGSKYEKFIEEIQFMASHLIDLKGSLKVLRVEASKSIPSQFVVDRAIVSDKKAYPKKSVVIIVSTLSAFLFALFLLVVFGFIRQAKK